MPKLQDHDPARVFEDMVGKLVSRHRSLEAPGTSRKRIVVIVGAGASARSGLPLWKEMKQPIFELAERHFRDPQDFVDEVWEKLSPVIGLRDPTWPAEEARQSLLDSEEVTTDLVCGVACENQRLSGKVRALLHEEYSRSYRNPESAGPPPQLGYELLAHLLKHGFIDDIISFNFDEILDTAIRNELGPGEYDLIMSDQVQLPEAPPRKPRIIKLHGSISSPRSLRFTKAETGVLSRDMIDLLDRSLFYSPESDSDGDRELTSKVTFISLGYSWQDPDFAHWVASRYRNVSDIIIVRKDKEESRHLQRFLENAAAFKLQFLSTSRFTDRTGHGNRRSCISIDELLWALCSEIHKGLGGAYRLIPFSRHLLLGYIFGPKDPRDPNAHPLPNEHKKKTRLKAEVLLHTTKCKGMISASAMAENQRIHHYFRSLSEEGEPPAANLGAFLDPSVTADVKEIYFPKAKNLQDLRRLFYDFGHGPVHVAKYSRESRKIGLSRHSWKSFFDAQVGAIFESPQVEVARKMEPRTEWLFEEPKPLRTFVELQKHSRQILEGSSWRTLLLVTETGNWLFKESVYESFKSYMESDAQRRVLMLEADLGAFRDEWLLSTEAEHDLLEKRPSLDQQIISGKLQAWRHNRHLTLGVDAGGKFTGGIYFRRRFRATRIAPVLVTSPNDCMELFLTFLSYVRRASRHDLEGSAALREAAWELACSIPRPDEEDLRGRLGKLCGELRSLDQTAES